MLLNRNFQNVRIPIISKFLKRSPERSILQIISSTWFKRLGSIIPIFPQSNVVITTEKKTWTVDSISRTQLHRQFMVSEKLSLKELQNYILRIIRVW